jgi:hypothetical protein
MPIDWAASGEWFQGWATIIGAGAVIYAAHKAVNIFHVWRRQKIEEMRIERAERILTAAYRAKFALILTRRTIAAREHAAEHANLMENDAHYASLDEADQFWPRAAQIVLSRYDQHRADFEEVDACRWLARAHFGEELEDSVAKFWSVPELVRIAAEELLHHDPDARLEDAQERLLRRPNWDAYSELHDEAIVEIERICGNIIRTEVRKIEAH